MHSHKFGSPMLRLWYNLWRRISTVAFTQRKMQRIGTGSPAVWMGLVFVIQKGKQEDSGLQIDKGLWWYISIGHFYPIVACSNQEYVWFKVANGTGKNQENLNPTKLVKSWIILQRAFPISLYLFPLCTDFLTQQPIRRISPYMQHTQPAENPQSRANYCQKWGPQTLADDSDIGWRPLNWTVFIHWGGYCVVLANVPALKVPINSWFWLSFIQIRYMQVHTVIQYSM